MTVENTFKGFGFLCSMVHGKKITIPNTKTSLDSQMRNESKWNKLVFWLFFNFSPRKWPMVADFHVYNLNSASERRKEEKYIHALYTSKKGFVFLTHTQPPLLCGLSMVNNPYNWTQLALLLLSLHLASFPANIVINGWN